MLSEFSEHEWFIVYYLVVNLNGEPVPEKLGAGSAFIGVAFFSNLLSFLVLNFAPSEFLRHRMSRLS